MANVFDRLKITQGAPNQSKSTGGNVFDRMAAASGGGPSPDATSPVDPKDPAAVDAWLKKRYADPLSQNTDASTGHIAKEVLKGAGKQILDPMGISHGDGVQDTGISDYKGNDPDLIAEKGEPMWGIGGPSKSSLGPQGPAQEFGYTAATAPMLATGLLRAGQAVAGRVGHAIENPALREKAASVIPKGKEMRATFQELAKDRQDYKGQQLAEQHRTGSVPPPPKKLPSWTDMPQPVTKPAWDSRLSSTMPSRPQPPPTLPSGNIPGPAPNMPPPPRPVLQAAPTNTPQPRVQEWPAPGTVEPMPPPGRPPMPQRTPLQGPPSSAPPLTESNPMIGPMPKPVLNSNRMPGGIQNQVPLVKQDTVPTPAGSKATPGATVSTPESNPTVLNTVDKVAKAEALKNEIGGTPGEHMTIPFEETAGAGQAAHDANSWLKDFREASKTASNEELAKGLQGNPPEAMSALRDSIIKALSPEASAIALKILGLGEIPQMAKGGVVLPAKTVLNTVRSWEIGKTPPDRLSRFILKQPNVKLSNGESFNAFKRRVLGSLKSSLQDIKGKASHKDVDAEPWVAKLVQAWAVRGYPDSMEIDSKLMASQDMPQAATLRLRWKGSKPVIDKVSKGSK